jgi:NADH-quinone oxidoreductase subunit G
MKRQDDTITIDQTLVPIEGEKNILELVRKAGIDLPTFCYHSELSVYGACRLCMVEVVGRGLMWACSTPPEPGMIIKTTTQEIRGMRKIIVELLLASHEQACPTCAKSASCQLQDLARKLGVTSVRYKPRKRKMPLDMSSDSLMRDPNKCVLCGDCVRVCAEVQSVGIIDFAYRGAQSTVMPCFGRELGKVECVNCGQCARVCPTGAIVPKPEIEDVWRVLDDGQYVVVAQVAPAVRVALGELFGLEPGTAVTGQLVTALRKLGFNRVFDTSFTADLTVIEETHEFMERFKKGERLPQFTSCCPAWVKFMEQYYPEMLPNLSSCRSPQQMFGSLCKEMLSSELGVKKEQIKVVSIMPCTAKKAEARRPEFEHDGQRDVDYVLTTQELARMIEEAGMPFKNFEPESFDMPFGFKTGAGIIFGTSGGVSEAVLRLAVEKITGKRSPQIEFPQVRGDAEVRELELKVGDATLRLAIVSGLANARKILEKVKSGEAAYDLIEVMACPGGCIGGAGQPVYREQHVKNSRTKGLYDHETHMQLRHAQDNPFVQGLYKTRLDGIGGRDAHKLLHTAYQSQRRSCVEDVPVHTAGKESPEPVEIAVCFGTSCFLRGSQQLMHDILEYIKDHDLARKVDVRASFCFEQCDRGPTVRIGNEVINKCTMIQVAEQLKRAL